MTGEPLTLALQAPIEAALAPLRAAHGREALSEWTFSNLYLFRHVHGWRFVPGDWPAVVGRGYDGAPLVLPLFDIAQAPQAALQTLAPPPARLYPVSDRQAAALDLRRFDVQAWDGDADYVYDAQAFIDYAGRPLASRRSQLRQFTAACVPCSRPFGEDRVADCRHVLAQWMAQKGKAGGEADESPCLEALQHARAFGLRGFVHWVDGEPAGFVLGQSLAPGVQAIRFAKGLDRHVGLYPFMFRHFCVNFEAQFGEPVRWLNFEQDMGLPGLRRSKRSYAPAALLAKRRLAPLAD